MALHTGVAEQRDGDYFGQPLNRVARLLSAGHGGQVLLSTGTHEMVCDSLEAGVSLLDLGENRLKDLLRPERVFQLVAPGLPSQFPPLRTLDNRPGNLPRQTTILIGREKEAAEVVALLRHDDVAMVTLTGPGGTGKTRLALHTATDLINDYADGCWFVDLSPVMNPELVMLTIATTLGVRESAGTPLSDALATHLHNKELLLVLDNFEQILAAAEEVSDLLDAAPGVKVLATSREALNLYGEHIYPVPPLQLPERPDSHRPPPTLEELIRYESVQLFLDRAQARNHDFQVTDATAAVVAEICRGLDGLPLAIELAAARANHLSVEEIRAQLNDRLGLLVGGPRNRTSRQQSLRAAIAWSYDMLDPCQQRLFRQLGVFVGGFTPGIAATVCALGSEAGRSVAVELLNLVQKSLVRKQAASGGEPRFWLLETLQEFARGELNAMDEIEEVRARHAHTFRALAEEAEIQLRGAQQGAWMGRLEEEHDNMRAALRWARERNDATLGCAIAGALWRFWWARGYWTEGREQLAAVLALPGELATPEGQIARGKALNGLGAIVGSQGEYDLAAKVYEESLAIWQALDDQQRIALALNNLANMAWYRRDYTKARSLYEESLEIKRMLDDKWGITVTLDNLAGVAVSQQDFTAARTFYEEALALSRALNDKTRIALALNGLGSIDSYLGEYARARPFLEEGLALRRELNDKAGLANSLSNLGEVAAGEGDHVSARTLQAEAIDLYRTLGDRRGVITCLRHLAGVIGAGDSTPEGTARAARIWGATEALREAFGMELSPSEMGSQEQLMAPVRSRLEPSAWSAAWEAGRGLSLEQAIALALDEPGSQDARL
jgi:predicted ATPase